MKMKKPQQRKVRSHVAVSAHMRNSAGAMGGGKRAQRRADRQNTKRALRAGSED
jgi:hypothetical protein